MLLAASSVPMLTLPGRCSPSVLELAAGPLQVVLRLDVLDRVAACQEYLVKCVGEGRPVYGATTGFGPLVDYAGREAAVDQCENVLDHLTAGQGPDLDPAVVRAALLVRLWSLSHGRSGVSPGVLEALVAALGTRFAPAVPEFGSVGASGDLIPLAYVARALRGQGYAYLGGERLPAEKALREVGLAPLELDGRDALGLVNGTSLTVAAAGLALARISRSHRVALMLCSVLADLLGSDPVFLGPQLLQAFGHPQAVRAGEVMRAWLEDTVPSGARPLQEPYSIRCTPQLLGAVGTVLAHAEAVVGDDLNGVSDNPLFFPEVDLVAHGGNFFGQPVAFAADMLSSAAVQMANLAERQLDLLLDPHRNGGLPHMLAVEPGRQHGLQGVQLAATATVAAMRRAAVPAAVQSLPTNGHNQDVVPFGTQAALNALTQAGHLRRLHGSLALALRQAAYVGERCPTAARCSGFMERLAAVVAPVDPDRPLDQDTLRAADLLDVIADEEPGMGAPSDRRG